jgi:hypothetical protein
MLGIAVGMMQKDGYTNQIKHKDLERIVEDLWQNYPPQLPPYPDAMQGNRSLDSLPIRIKENSSASETILKDVRSGGILVQDLSGRDVFKFAHKSYLEYLASAFFAGFTLQNEHERANLMMVNAIAKAHKFSSFQLKGSPDVEIFIAELIVAQIELKDQKKEEVLPINGNEEKYEQKLFKVLILKPLNRIERWYPKAKIWLSLHTDIPYFLWIGIFGFLLAFAILFDAVFNQNKNWPFTIGLNTLLCLFWAGLTLKYWLKKTSLQYRRIEYLSKFHIYLLSCRLLKCKSKSLSKNTIVLINGVDRIEAFQELRLMVIATFLTGSGVLVNTIVFLFFAGFLAGFLVVFAVACTGAVAFTNALKVERTFIRAAGIAFAAVSATAAVYGVAYIFMVGILIAFEFPIIFAAVVLSTIAFLFIIFLINKLKINYQESILNLTNALNGTK